LALRDRRILGSSSLSVSLVFLAFLVSSFLLFTFAFLVAFLVSLVLSFASFVFCRENNLAWFSGNRWQDKWNHFVFCYPSSEGEIVEDA